MSPVDIAIIGMSCRLPMANSLDKFWNNLCQSKECLTRFSDEQLITAGASSSLIKNPQFVPVKGILSNVDQFDANFFGLTPAEANMMDPQQRLFLECAWEALEHSSSIPNKCHNKVVSVFSGMADSCYLQENLLKNSWFHQQHDWLQARVATSIGTLSTQLSYRLNLQGCSISLNTACSTGLVAVSQACQDLLLGHSDLALAGAVAIELPQIKGYLYEAGGIHSADGHCRPFAYNANGTVFSNGVGVVVLKRLADAITNRDTIYAVIKGCGINNDGSDKLNYFAPSISGQASCIHRAFVQAEISAADIGFTEAHGTATVLGDLVEMTALTQVYRQFTEKKQYCILGSVKGNIGHTDIAAGIASLIKVALCLYHQKIPATLHFEQPNPQIDYQNSPFYVNTELMAWSSLQHQRYAAVSAFGIGGTNSHLILSEYSSPAIGNVNSEISAQLIIVSAKTKTALQETVYNLNDHLKKDQTSIINLENVAYTLQKGRDDFPWRAIAVGSNIDELTQTLNNAQMKKFGDEESNVVFMFPGQGSQYHKMAFDLYQKFPFFAKCVNQYCQMANRHLTADIREMMFGASTDLHLNNAAYAQVALFIIEYALAQLLMSWGIKPMAVIGHSSGEYVAACLAEVISLEDVLFLICQRGRLMESTETGAMMAITCTIEDFAEYLKKFPVELAAHNALLHCVATGKINAIYELKQYVEQQGKACQVLKVDHAFHSRWMEPILISFKEIANQIQLSPPQLPIISNLTGDLFTTEEITSDYWSQHLRRPVQFKKGIDTLIAQGYTFFIEVGPGQTLSYFVESSTVENHSSEIDIIHTLPSVKQKEKDYFQLLTALGVAWQNGVNIDWSVFHSQKQLQRIALPTYPFERQRHWLEADVTNSDSTILEQSISEIRFFQPTWLRRATYATNIISADICQKSWIIFKNETGLGDKIVSDLQAHGFHPIVIEAGSDEYCQINSQHYIINPAKKTHYVNLFSVLKNIIFDVPIIIHLFSCNEESKGFLTDKQIDHQLNRGFYSVLYLVQAYIEKFGDSSSLKCAVITEYSQQVLGDDDVRPINATLTGICRVIGQEHPSFNFQLIDISPDSSGSNFHNLPRAIIQYCIQGKWNGNNPIIAFRQGFQWQLDYMNVDLEQKNSRFRDKGVYLITGGLGDIALALCEKILQTVTKPTFILLTRSAMPPSSEWEGILKDLKQEKLHYRIKQFQRLLELGAILSVKQADVGQFESITSIIQEVLRSYGQINGVIHAAGHPGGGLIQLKTFDMAQSVLSPKIQGTYYLAEAVKDLPIDFVVLCSSLSALVGEPGQIDYCSANACLDAFAASHLFRAPMVISINWNTWKEIGMAVKTAKPQGLAFLEIENNITPSQGQEIFMKIMQNDYPQIAVSSYEITSLAQLIDEKNRKENTPFANKDRKGLNIQTSFVPTDNEIEIGLLKLWQDALGIQDIGMEDDFFNLGGHSLCALGLVNKINKAFDCRLTIQDLYVARTIRKLLIRITTRQKDELDNVWVSLRHGQSRMLNIFLCPPVSGMLFCYNKMLSLNELPHSIYGLQDSGIKTGQLVFSDLISMAKAYCVELQKIQPHGPYYLIGYSFGATLAYEMAHLLQQQGEKIELLAMIDGWAIFSPEQYLEGSFTDRIRHFYPDLSPLQIDLAWMRMNLLLHHHPSQANVDMILFKAERLLEEYQRIDEPYNGWRQYNKGYIIRTMLSADHESIMNEINSMTITHYLRNLLNGTGKVVK